MKPITLNEVEVDDIRKLARERRQFLGFVGDTPIANDIFTILDKLNILLLEYPIESDNSSPAFSAAIMYSEEGNHKLTFIGLKCFVGNCHNLRIFFYWFIFKQTISYNLSL